MGQEEIKRKITKHFEWDEIKDQEPTILQYI